MKLKIYLPIKGAILTQGFSKNFNAYYKAGGLLGHTGMDFISYVSNDILTAVEGAYTYKILNKNNPDLSKYRSIYQIVDTEDGCFEVSYGHCSRMDCPHGPSTLGTKIAEQGNTGNVFVGGREITTSEKNSGSKAGTHVHLQLRKLQKRTYRIQYDSYLEGEDGNAYTDGKYYYAIPNYNNGFNGCIDPAPYLVQQVASASYVNQVENHFDTPLPANIQTIIDHSPSWTSIQVKKFLDLLRQWGILKK